MGSVDETRLFVRISKATQLVWEGMAAAVSSKNSQGPFDVLPMHTNFITLIQGHPIVVTGLDGSKQEYQFKQTVLYNKDNEVKIFADIA